MSNDAIVVCALSYGIPVEIVKRGPQLVQLVKDKKVKTDGMILVKKDAEGNLSVSETGDHLGHVGVLLDELGGEGLELADEPPAIIYGAGGYVVKRGPEAIAGSTMENAGFDASVTPDGLDRLRQVAARIYPSLADGEIRRSWAGLRPQTPDGRPIIGPDPHASRLWYATGHGRNGILLAGYTGELVARLHSGETIEHDLSCVMPGRFWNW